MSTNANMTTESDSNSAARWGTLVILVVVLIAALVVASVVNGSRSPNPQLSAPISQGAGS